MTDEELINAAVEKTLLMLPEVIGNLITSHVEQLERNRNLYSKYPEFRKNKLAVASVIEMVEGDNPLDNYDEIIKKAIPKIKERIEMTKDMNTTSITSDFSKNLNGII